MQESLRVRDANRGDIEKLAEFNAALAMETESKALDLQILTQGVTAVFDKPARGQYLIAESNGQVIGCLLITYEWSDWRNGDWWWIQSVYVAQSARRTGVFSALYRDAEGRAAATENVVGLRLYVEWENERAQKTYEQLGMCKEHYHMYFSKFDLG